MFSFSHVYLLAVIGAAILAIEYSAGSSHVFNLSYMNNMALQLWQYGLWSFQMGGTRLERFLHKNQHTQRKLLNFEFWINGEMSNIGHHLKVWIL